MYSEAFAEEKKKTYSTGDDFENGKEIYKLVRINLRNAVALVCISSNDDNRMGYIWKIAGDGNLIVDDVNCITEYEFGAICGGQILDFTLIKD